MIRIASLGLLLAATALLAGCPKKSTTAEPPVAGAQVGSGASSRGSSDEPSTSGSALDGADAASGRGVGGAGSGAGGGARAIIYFDFDQSEIKAEYADIVSANAQNLTSHQNLKVRLEGSTDERGTREYNIGLGERRAQSVRRALMLQGVPETQITTVSFGAERPAADGDDESAWKQNRRVELVYLP